MTETAQLPATIRTYLTAHQGGDQDTALATFAPDAEVTDEGRTHRGHAEIGEWLRTGASEYTYTIELTGTERMDDTRWVATHHLEGDFPGGVVDLHFRFALDGDRIQTLVIEP
jgi:hypothetical protein